MLFDLRGRGRRRTVQVIYVFLAILIGGGLVLFGIGGSTNGGLVDAITGNGGGGGSSDSLAQKQVDSATKATRLQPEDAAAWLRLTRARYQLANVKGYDRNTGGYNADGKGELRLADTAWTRYLALDPKAPDVNVASLMVQAYGPTGLNQAEKAVTAQEVITEQKGDDYAQLAQLALLAYEAKQLRKGDLAADKALRLAPKDQRAQLKRTLDQAKQAPALQEVQKALEEKQKQKTTTSGK
jgi:hypothetical protein